MILWSKNPAQCCLNTLGTKFLRSKSHVPASREETPDNIAQEKNTLQCCLNTPETTLHRENSRYAMCFERLQVRITGKNLVQVCLNNNIWSLFGNF